MSLTNLNTGKSPAAPSNPPPVQSGPATSSFESSRRQGQGGPSAAHTSPAPRKSQASRKQHKNQRRPALNDRGNNPLDGYDAMAEMRAMRNPSGRRGQTSITHLLNYSSPRPSYHDHSSFARSYRRNPAWGPGSGYDKSRYVHANYRFVVSPEAQYTKHAADPDLHIDWSNVMQVIASSESQVSSCPICLSDPVAPRMAKCGHIFCLPCLIRFMNSASGDDDQKTGKGARWKKCPICEDIIYLHEVRPVRFYAGQESPLPRVGDDVVLRLMARNATSTLALPRESGAEVLNSGDDIPWHYAANVLDYARVMKATGSYMAQQYDEEISALIHQEKEDETLFGQDGEWTQRAVKAVNAAKEKVVSLGASEGSGPVPSTGSSKSHENADFYFYSSPPHLYLSPLDIRILKTKFGSFSSFPSTLLPRVEHISTGHLVDDALRKRAKYLGHLPQGCVISFLECDWTDIVPADILQSFATDIERRRKRNREKAAQEDRERLQAERLEAAALRATTGAHRPIEPLEEEPTPRMDLSEFQPLGGHANSSPPEPRTGFATLAEMSTSPTAQRTIWGTRAIAASPDLTAIQKAPVDDGWLNDEDVLGTAEMAMQMEAIQISEQGPSDPVKSNAPGGGGGGKKKKKQKITLMSTGGRRGT